MKKTCQKHALSFFLCLLFTLTFQTQNPKLISYQELLTDNSGTALANGDYSIIVNLYDVAEGGAPLWSEGINLFSVSYDFGMYLDYILPFDGVSYETGNGDHAE